MPGSSLSRSGSSSAVETAVSVTSRVISSISALSGSLTADSAVIVERAAASSLLARAVAVRLRSRVVMMGSFVELRRY
jgi:hypothetical protein